MTFEEWLKSKGMFPWNSFYIEDLAEVLNAAIDACQDVIYHRNDVPLTLDSYVDALKTYLNTPTSDEQGGGNTHGA